MEKQEQKKKNREPVCTCKHGILLHVSDAGAMMACRDSHCICGVYRNAEIAQLTNKLRYIAELARDGRNGVRATYNLIIDCAEN